MTILTTIPTSATRPFAWRTAVLLARLRRLINRFLAAVIARHERHAARVALHRLDDRQLQDLAMTRSEIESRPRRIGADPRANAAARLALTGACGVAVFLSVGRNCAEAIRLSRETLRQRADFVGAHRVLTASRGC